MSGSGKRGKSEEERRWKKASLTLKLLLGIPIKKEGPWGNYQQRPVESREEGWGAEGEGELVTF